jgi:nucleotide-binding universal stress UspA family protein
MAHDVDIRKILLGYDGSESAERAVDLAVSLAHKYDAEIIVVHAYPRLPRMMQPSQEDVREIHEARESVEALVKRLAKDQLEVTPDVLEGPAAEAILNVADAHDVDLIIVGRRGLGKFSGLLLGSTSDRVLQYATVPVLVAH